MLPGQALSFVRATALCAALSACAHPEAPKAASPSCAPHMIALAGACVDEADARAYCGSDGRPEAGGCAPRTCPTDEPLDLATGECVPHLQLRKVAALHKLTLKEEASLGCGKDGAELSLEGTSFACLPRASLCGRGAHASDDGCHPDAVCASGSVADLHGVCTPVTHQEHGEKRLDVGTWLRLVVGPDGSEGAVAVCGPLVRRPWIADVSAHGSAILDVDVSIVFPDNDVGQARVTARARRRFDPHSADPPALLAVTEHLEPIWKALRGIGGVASAASVSVGVHCTLNGGTTAVPLPASPADAKDGGRDAPAAVESGKPAS